MLLVYCQRISCPSEGATSKSKFTFGLTAKKQYVPIAASISPDFIRTVMSDVKKATAVVNYRMRDVLHLDNE